jgi:hypothetical protein
MEVYILTAVCVLMATYNIIHIYLSKKEIDKLTDKLIAKNFNEYSTVQQMKEEEITKRKLKQPHHPKSSKIF